MSTTAHCPECQTVLPTDGFAGLCPRCVARSLEDHLIHPAALENRGERPIVPGWDVLEPVGAGGQGIVWRAVRLEDDVMGAVKVFRADLTDGWESAARMEGEAAALRTLEHSGIVRVLDCGETVDEQFYVITEFIEGCDLQRLMHAQKLPVERVLEITQRVVEAVSHAHERGLVHRDLKPANVLIGRDGTVKLADFSLARRLDASARITMTQDGTTFGTPYYLAPEVMRGEAATTSSDIYALGVMLYEMLTGAPPAGRFTRVSEKCDLPREVDALIESLLAEGPTNRPDSAEVVLKKLRELDEVRAGALAARLRRHRWKFAAAIAASIFLAGVIGYLIPRPIPPPPPPPKLNARGFANAAATTRSEPLVNSLGMSFIPVPGVQGVLFARYETKSSDFIQSMTEGMTDAAWLEAFGGVMGTRNPLSDVRPSGWEPQSHTATVVQMMALMKLAPEAAASGINLYQARRFCAWLTWREQREGRLTPSQFYRLPTDEEWSLAAGLPPETLLDVHERHRSIPQTEVLHPWGKAWPPPPGFANYAGTEARDANWPAAWANIEGRNDDFPRTAPVGRFAETSTGLYDIWGNLWEWCESKKNVVSAEMTLRGGSWVDGGFKPQLRMDYRRFERPNLRETCVGFRCVLVVPDLPAQPLPKSVGKKSADQ